MINKKGFTLIELLAVITIMGILVLIAIPAISRTIENSRKDTFVNTSKTYINAIKNSVSADELKSSTDSTPISAFPDGYYYYSIDSADSSGQDLVDQGGKSSWGNADVQGFVVIHKTIENNIAKYEYAITLVDSEKGVLLL